MYRCFHLQCPEKQALRTNYIKFHIDKNAESPLCRVCGERGETIFHLNVEN